MVDTAELDYELPDARIAQAPREPRDSARLLVDHGDRIDDAHVGDLADLLDPGDLVVLNRTRVLPARLHLVKETGGAAEVLLLEARPDLGDGCWEALVRPGRRLPAGTRLVNPRSSALLSVVVGADLGEGRRAVVLAHGDQIGLADGIEATGEIPLPPYIKARPADPERYQTIYSDPRHPESAAAPTAGLHLTRRVLGQLEDRGIAVAMVDLVVGIGTFRPISTDTVEDHHMHSERYRVPESVVVAGHQTHDRGGRVVAVGTTTVRALESVASTGALEGRTDLFIRDGFEFRVVDRLLTNFHQPRSSLLAMIDAFVGPDRSGARRWRHLYDHALAGDYRFLSFGDAMLLSRHG